MNITIGVIRNSFMNKISGVVNDEPVTRRTRKRRRILVRRSTGVDSPLIEAIICTTNGTLTITSVTNEPSRMYILRMSLGVVMSFRRPVERHVKTLASKKLTTNVSMKKSAPATKSIIGAALNPLPLSFIG